MSEEIEWRPRYGKHYRRKRSVLGKDWVAPSMQDVTKGIWCARCATRHPYVGKNRLLSTYERQGKVYVLHWLCPKSGDYIGEVLLPTEEHRKVERDDSSI